MTVEALLVPDCRLAVDLLQVVDLALTLVTGISAARGLDGRRIHVLAGTKVDVGVLIQPPVTCSSPVTRASKLPAVATLMVAKKSKKKAKSSHELSKCKDLFSYTAIDVSVRAAAE